MKLKQLEYFQVICKYNNITRASEVLHISQPSLSNTIRELEEEFGVPLFQRQSHGLLLTEQGEILLEETKLLLRQANHLTTRMKSLSAEKPVIRLGVPPMLGLLIFPHLLQIFHEKFPHIQLEMVENGSLVNQRMVQEGILDAALVSSDMDLPPCFRCHELCQIHVSFYISVHHKLASRSFITLKDVEDIPLALQAEGSFLTDFIKRHFLKNNLNPDIMLQTNQLATIQQLVRNNTAAAFLFDGILPESPDVRRLPVKDLPSVHAKLIWNKDQEPSAETQKLIDLSPFYSNQPQNTNTKA